MLLDHVNFFTQQSTPRGQNVPSLFFFQEPDYFWIPASGCIWDTWVWGRGTSCLWLFVFAIKDLQVGNVLLCELVRQLISLGAYEPWIQVWESFENLLMNQDLVAPAQYWHDPFNQTHFLVFNNRLRCWPVLSPLIWKAVQSGSHYLADLNNEREWKNETYKEVLAGLENLVLVMWDGDTTIVPKVVFLQSHF